MPTSEEFLRHLRDALNHLYDPDHLRRSPLISLFNVGKRFDAPAALQRILIEAVEALQPKAGEAGRSHSRRVYELLLYRYVQQFSQQEVANQLGVSVRHLRREQRAALEALAWHLWEQFRLEGRVESAPGAMISTSAVDSELAWLKEMPPEKTTDLGETLPALVELMRPLAAQYGVRLEVSLADGLPELAAHPVAVRQALLNLLSVAIHRAHSGQVAVLVSLRGWEVMVQVRGARRRLSPAVAWGEEGSILEITYRLAQLCGGMLEVSTDEMQFKATLLLPGLEQTPVLVIDDNPDTLQLLQRYAVGTRYRLIGTRDPEQVFELAAKCNPQLIVLDVMMPQVDGWELLGRLRQHPLTAHIPVIVCTILAQEELALSLGASGFIRKPVTRQAFLEALDQQCVARGPESR